MRLFPPTDPGPETESLWRRAYRDTERIRHSRSGNVVAFLVSVTAIILVDEALASASKASAKIALFVALAALSVFVAYGLVYVGQLAAAFVRQRDEWRKWLGVQRHEHAEDIRSERERGQERWQAEREAFDKQWKETERIRGLLGDAEARIQELKSAKAELDAIKATVPRFPRCEIELEPYLYADLTEEQDGSTERLLLFKVRVTNREESQRLNLTLDLGVVWDPRPEEVNAIHSRFFGSRTKANRQFENTVLPDIVEIDPGTTKNGFLKFDAETPWVVFGDDHHFEPGAEARFEATIKDYVTGQSITMNVPGIWSS